LKDDECSYTGTKLYVSLTLSILRCPPSPSCLCLQGKKYLVFQSIETDMLSAFSFALALAGLLTADAATIKASSVSSSARRLDVSTTCSAQPMESTPSSLNCNTRGRLAYRSQPTESFNATDTFECAFACLTKQGCISFELDSMGFCNLFKVTLDQQGLNNKKTDYGDVFFNVRYRVTFAR